ncbi:MAG3240 family lipoprotein [Metamycoplasma hominis]|uniref:MAG3240 family lipoprotein n=1 Tax=Metamycoplasma hominis TaxID=2098 RepID=UPI0019396BF1
MKKKFYFNSILIASSLSFMPLIICSCQTKKDNYIIEGSNAYIDISKISRVFLHRLSIGQIAALHNMYKIFYYYDNSNKKQYYDSAYVNGQKLYLRNANKNVEYKLNFPIKPSWKQEISKFDNINIVKSNKPSDINNFLNEYSFDEVDSAGDVNDEWYSILGDKWKKDFNRNNDPYFEDMQTVIFRLIQDTELNYSIMKSKYLINSKRENVITQNLFKNKYIQASSWLNDEEHEQHRQWFKRFLVIYLNKFNVNVGDVDIDWKNAKIVRSFSGTTDYIKFKFKDIKDWNGKSLLRNDKKNIEYYINGFRTYATNQKFGVGNQGLKEELPLFNDYVPNPLLEIDGMKFMNIIDNINYFVKGATDINYWNAKGLMYLFQSFKNEPGFFKLAVPEYKKNEDKEYKIIDFEYTPYFKTNQIFKAIVRVFKLNGTYKDYVLISSNFDDHGHRLKGLITKNALPNELKASDIYSIRADSEPIKQGIKLDDFIDKNNKNSVFRYMLNESAKKLENIFEYWNNNNKQNYEVANLLLAKDPFQLKLLASYLNNYLLAYALENKAGEVFSGIKRIDLNIVKLPNQPIGRLYLKMDFVSYANNQDFKFKSKNEKIVKSVYLYWNGFKGYDQQKYGNEYFTIDKITDGDN